MLISEPYDASIHAPKDLTGLGHPCLRLPPTPCPWPRGPISARPQAPSPALRNAGGDLLPKLLFELSSWIDLASGWWPRMSRWSLGCPLNPALLTYTERPFMCQACLSTGDLVYMTNFCFKASLSFWSFEWSDFRSSCELTHFSTQVRCSNCASLRNVWVPVQKPTREAFPFCS